MRSRHRLIADITAELDEEDTMSEKMMGLQLTVLRPADFPDCTLNGVSARHSRLVLVGFMSSPETVVAPMPYDSRVVASTNDDAVVLVYSNLNGSLPHLVPFSALQSGAWIMFGGNMASGDSRLGRLVRERFGGPSGVHAICVHDRIERKGE